MQDNLNTHKPASLYEAFPAAEARRLVERFEWHYTPKHGSWLDMAESELGVLSSQCLDRRIPDKQTLIEEVAAWEDEPQQEPRQSRLAVHHRRRPRQAEEAVPSVMNNSGALVPFAEMTTAVVGRMVRLFRLEILRSSARASVG